ncbi:family 20 glycosylhydrolase [Microbacterium sediminis]|uniref:beta-N-acetylhexosaminidase n=1 Tax=Microbacterium sediminis TaxID=904291 RepID=A0A1B9N8E7_9MICO|nr:family 20 glycosylhydrolase [Microbacterium sediminis]OCG72860.1 beta-N-acetylhexosaminidase [Microbacterium sediminis]
MPLAVLPWPASVSPLDAPPLRLSPAAATRSAAAAQVVAEAERRVDPTLAAEAYALRVTAAGATRTAATEAGFFYAKQTLRQLVDADAEGPFVPAVEIRDEPRFAYRGVMLDVARHFHPVSTIEAVIDRTAALKFNALHLHLTDDQGWRLALDRHPELAAEGSATSILGDPGGFYTRDDYMRIVEYAAERHLIVVPAFDLPGHTHALSLSHPELSAEPVLSDHMSEVHAMFPGQRELPARGVPYIGAAVGFSSLRADAPGLEPFLREVLGEIAELTPGPYLHIGGDEALGTSREDFRAVVGLATRIVAETGKTPVAWHEAGDAPLPRGSVGQYWGFVAPADGADEKARAFVANGGSLILSPADAIYLDRKYDESTPIGLRWANGPTSVERSYRWEPADVIAGVPEEAILGVEAPLWTETVRDLAAIDLLLFPRICSAAEAAWSRPVGTPERTWESFRSRVGRLGPLWDEAGIGYHRSPEIDWA